MKRLAIAVALLVASSVQTVLANPITDAVKEQAWPLYTCQVNVNGKDVSLKTDSINFQSYRIGDGINTETFSLNLDDLGVGVLMMIVTPDPEDTNKKQSVAYLYNGRLLVGKYNGFCTK